MTDVRLYSLWLQSPYPVEIGSLGNNLESCHTFLLPSKKRITPQARRNDLHFQVPGGVQSSYSPNRLPYAGRLTYEGVYCLCFELCDLGTITPHIPELSSRQPQSGGEKLPLWVMLILGNNRFGQILFHDLNQSSPKEEALTLQKPHEEMRMQLGIVSQGRKNPQRH